MLERMSIYVNIEMKTFLLINSFYITLISRMTIPNPLTQWAAVNIHSSEIMDPPHEDVSQKLLHLTNACQGYSWIVDFFPPTILSNLPSRWKLFFFPHTRIEMNY